MTANQPALFGEAQEPQPGTTQQHDERSHRVRTCRNCNTEYVKQDRPGALNVYCSLECRTAWMGVKAPGPTKPDHLTCGGCGQPHTTKHRQSRNYRWNLCADCLTTIEANQTQFAAHKVPPHLIHQFIQDPSCPICGTNIAGRTQSSRDKFKPAAVIDHDHNCCQRAQSCGQCVRGIICADCNHLLPHRPAITKILRGALDYINAWENQ